MTARVSFVAGLKSLGIALAWLAAFLVVGVGVIVLLAWIVPDAPDTWWLARGAAIQALGFGVATWVVGRRLNRRSWAELGWRSAASPPRAFGRGAGLGLAMAVLAIGVSVVAGGAHLRFVALRGSSLGAAGAVLLGLLCAALSEELLFRGYPLRRLSEAVGPAGATLLLSSGFAASHLGNPNATAPGVVNIALAGFWLSVAFFSPGGMTLAWGAHFGWNAALGELFDAPVSGYSLAAPVVHYAPGGHAWLDGGRFGPEGGVVATIAFLAGAAALLGSRLTQPRRWAAP